MSDSKVNIVPCDVSVINKIGSFTIILQNFKLGESVDLIVTLFNTENIYVSTISIPLAGEDYNLWGNDDDYLVNFICGKLNFTPELVSFEETKE